MPNAATTLKRESYFSSHLLIVIRMADPSFCLSCSAADLRHYAIPDLMEKLETLEKRKQSHSAAPELEADIVTSDAIAEIVARWTGIPTTKLKSSEKEKLLKMEKNLQKEVVGQPEAVHAVANAIRLSRSGLAAEGKPTASFLFCESLLQ